MLFSTLVVETGLYGKQNVDLALAVVFGKTNVLLVNRNAQTRNDMHGFLTLIHTRCKVVNAKLRFPPNTIGNALIT